MHDGVARGALTPLYSGLSVQVTGHGSGGIIGAHGIIGGVARGLASLVMNATKLHGGNPDAPGRLRAAARSTTSFAPSETLPGFLWVSLREGLLVVMLR